MVSKVSRLSLVEPTLSRTRASLTGVWGVWGVEIPVVKHMVRSMLIFRCPGFRCADRTVVLHRTIVLWLMLHRILV
jgi:hypothetical protein